MLVGDAQAFLSAQGELIGEGVARSEKLYADAAAWFARPADLAPETLLYEVFSYTRGTEAGGNLNVGVTVLKPLTIAGECNMTRGHWHADRSCAEVYHGVAGEGLLLLMDDTGRTWAERVAPGSLHVIDGCLAHRLVNTGAEDLKVAAVWDCAAGHDYDSVERMPFGVRVLRGTDGAVALEPVECDGCEVVS